MITMIKFTVEQRFIVTGASSGIGEGVALLLNELGATVIGIGRNQERLEGMRAKAKCPDTVFLEKKDLVEDIAGLPAYVKALKAKYGKFQGMAYCAGITALSPARVFDLEYARNVFDVNYFAPLFMVKGMIDGRNNNGNGTSLVVISSVDALLSVKGQSLYSGSKAGLSASMRAIAHEVAAMGIRINCLLPSMIRTPMTLNSAANDLGLVEDGDERYPFGWGTPKDVAGFVAFLLSNSGQHLSGQNFVVDSGGIY